MIEVKLSYIVEKNDGSVLKEDQIQTIYKTNEDFSDTTIENTIENLMNSSNFKDFLQNKVDTTQFKKKLFTYLYISEIKIDEKTYKNDTDYYFYDIGVIYFDFYNNYELKVSSSEQAFLK